MRSTGSATMPLPPKLGLRATKIPDKRKKVCCLPPRFPLASRRGCFFPSTYWGGLYEAWLPGVIGNVAALRDELFDRHRSLRGVYSELKDLNVADVMQTPERQWECMIE